MIPASSGSHSALPEAVDDDWRLALMRPYLASGLDLFDGSLARLQARGCSVNVHDFIRDMSAALADRVMEVAMRTLVLELNVARLEGRFADIEDGHERFRAFFRSLREEEGRRALVEEYPVLERELEKCFDSWCRHGVEVLERLATDLEVLRADELLHRGELSLKSIVLYAGDRHDGNRAVTLLGFDQGGLVYKPRSMRIDLCWASIVDEVGKRGLPHPIRTPRVVDRGNYGWAEFISPMEATSQDELERFFYRIGATAALLYFTAGTDFHHENLIAHRDQPVLIDLETTFSPARAGPFPINHFHLGLVERTVLASGLLPRPTAGGNGVVDVSGIGGNGVGLSDHRYLIYRQSGTDAMRADFDYVQIPSQGNQPGPRDPSAPPTYQRFRSSIREGFSCAYGIVEEHGADILRALDDFANESATVRVVLRPTKYYAQLRGESYHPDVMRDDRDRDSLLDHVLDGRDQVDWVAQVGPSERAALAEGDIPRFTSELNKLVLRTPTGDPIENFFNVSAGDRLKRRVLAAGQADREVQLWALDAALGLDNLGPTIDPAGYRFRDSSTWSPFGRCISRYVSDHCIVTSDGRRGWLALGPVGGGVVRPGPGGIGLYSGAGGIALYLAYASRVLGDSRLRDVARGVAEDCLECVTEAAGGGGATVDGAFGPNGGLIYLFSHLTALWGEGQWARDALQVAERVVGAVEEDRLYDVLSGSAGFILSLLSLDTVLKAEETERAVRRLCDHLLQSALRSGRTLAWEVPSIATQPLTGYSHGASGIGHALSAAGVRYGERRFVEAGLAAFEYERSVFHAASANWPDFRTEPAGAHGAPGDPATEDRFMTTWCHGAPGIGLARAAVLELLGESCPTWVREDFEVAVRTTLAEGAPEELCLCHGALGNYELLRLARYQGAECAPDALVHAYEERIEARVSAGGLRCTWHGQNAPGFMTGLSGVGWAALRDEAPNLIPNALILQPPRLL